MPRIVVGIRRSEAAPTRGSSGDPVKTGLRAAAMAVAVRQSKSTSTAEPGEFSTANDVLWDVHGLSGVRNSRDGARYAADTACGVAVASSVTALLDTGWIPRRVDLAGFAGLLWRGGAMDARLPVAGVVAFGQERLGPQPTAGPASVKEVWQALRQALAPEPGAPATRTVLLGPGVGSVVLAMLLRETGDGVVDAVTVAGGEPTGATIAEGRGVAHRNVRADLGNPEAVVESYLQAMDVPSAVGLHEWVLLRALRTAGVEAALSGLGGMTLFGDGPSFARRQRWRTLVAGRRGRCRDPLDVLGCRRAEIRAFRGIPVNRAQAERALFPAATREAITTTGPRPPDGIAATGTDLEIASDVEREGWLTDVRVRDADSLGSALGMALGFPFLDPNVVAAVRRLESRSRFGRPGSGGLLRRWLAEQRGRLPPRRGRVFAVPLDGWLRGPLAAWLDRVLDRARLEAQKAWRPEAVAEGLRRFRAGDAGWTAERVFYLASLAEWLDRRGMALGRT